MCIYASGIQGSDVSHSGVPLVLTMTGHVPFSFSAIAQTVDIALSGHGYRCFTTLASVIYIPITGITLLEYAIVRRVPEL